jgi:phosphate transport system protein
MEKHKSHFDDQLRKLAEKVMMLGGRAEEAIRLAVEAFQQKSEELAIAVVEGDEDVDRLEIEIDHDCMELMATRQPLARDFRLLATILKVTPELERIADLATNIAERVKELVQDGTSTGVGVVDIPAMADRSRGMLRDALSAFARADAKRARAIIQQDAELDEWMEHTFRVLVTHMLEDPRLITRALRHLMIAKTLERIGDHVTNVCEMIVYMSEGRIIRHMGESGLDDRR